MKRPSDSTNDLTKESVLIVTDLGQFKAYRLMPSAGESFRLETIESTMLEAAHRRLHENLTDMSGRRGAPGAPNQGTPLNDDHNLKLENQRRAIREIAGHIERVLMPEEGRDWLLAADRDINQPLLEELPERLRSALKVNLRCDLTKAGEKELIARFQAAAKVPASHL